MTKTAGNACHNPVAISLRTHIFPFCAKSTHNAEKVNPQIVKPDSKSGNQNNCNASRFTGTDGTFVLKRIMLTVRK